MLGSTWIHDCAEQYYIHCSMHYIFQCLPIPALFGSPKTKLSRKELRVCMLLYTAPLDGGQNGN